MTSDEIRDAILKMSRDELREVQTWMKARWEMLDIVDSNQFSVGDKIKFRAKNGEILDATVERVNNKSLSIVVDGGGKWRVHPSFCRKS